MNLNLFLFSIILIFFIIYSSSVTPKYEGFNNKIKFDRLIRDMCDNLKLKYTITKKGMIISDQEDKQSIEIKKFMIKGLNQKNQYKVNNKYICNSILSDHGLPIPISNYYPMIRNPNDIKQILKSIKINNPLVIKPTKGSFGRGVYPNIKTKAEIQDILNHFQSHKYKGSILIENHIEGEKYRILCLDDQIIDIILAKKIIIIGNGIDSIEKLVRIKNVNNKFIYPVKINKYSLKKKGLNLNTILPKGTKYVVNDVVNLTTGSRPIRVPNIIVHKDNLEIFQKINKILNLRISGIDFISPDITKSYKKNNAKIIEVNANPGTAGHFLADDTPSIEIHEKIIKKVFEL